MNDVYKNFVMRLANMAKTDFIPEEIIAASQELLADQGEKIVEPEKTTKVWTVQYTAYVTYKDHGAAQEYANYVDDTFYLDFEDDAGFVEANTEDVEIHMKEVPASTIE